MGAPGSFDEESDMSELYFEMMHLSVEMWVLQEVSMRRVTCQNSTCR